MQVALPPQLTILIWGGFITLLGKIVWDFLAKKKNGNTTVSVIDKDLKKTIYNIEVECKAQTKVLENIVTKFDDIGKEIVRQSTFLEMIANKK